MPPNDRTTAELGHAPFALMENRRPGETLLALAKLYKVNDLRRLAPDNLPIATARFRELSGNYSFVVLEDLSLRIMEKGRHGWGETGGNINPNGTVRYAYDRIMPTSRITQSTHWVGQLDCLRTIRQR
jgi:hypothetical protein